MYYEVGKLYVITKFDLSIYSLIMDSFFEAQETYLLIGTSHVICEYLKMIRKKMEGSGLQDTLLGSGHISSGLVDGSFFRTDSNSSHHGHGRLYGESGESQSILCQY